MGALPICSACPSVNWFMAANAMLKSGVATSIAVTKMLVDTPCAFLNVSFQHVPQAAELNPVTAGAPPMRGKLGREPNVVKPRVRRPLEPLEQATTARDWVELS